MGAGGVPTARCAWREARPEGVLKCLRGCWSMRGRRPVSPAPGDRTTFGGFAFMRAVGRALWNRTGSRLYPDFLPRGFVDLRGFLLNPIVTIQPGHIPFRAPAKRRKGPKSPQEETAYIRMSIAGERLNRYTLSCQSNNSEAKRVLYRESGSPSPRPERPWGGGRKIFQGGGSLSASIASRHFFRTARLHTRPIERPAFWIPGRSLIRIPEGSRT